MFVRLAFVWCLTVFQHQPVASYRVNLKKLVDEKVEQVKVKSASENVVEAEAEAVSSLVGEKVESATTGTWPRYYYHVGAGTLVSDDCKSFFHTSLWTNLGANLSQVKHSLQRVCTDHPHCLGYHVHEGEGHPEFMRGAIILGARAVWPMETPAYFLQIGANRVRELYKDSQAVNYSTSKGSVACGLGWENGWQAYGWNFHLSNTKQCYDSRNRTLIEDGGPPCDAMDCQFVLRLGKAHNCRNWCAEHGLDCKSSWLMIGFHDENGTLTTSSRKAMNGASCGTRTTGDLSFKNSFVHMPFCYVGSDQNYPQKCECDKWYG